MVVGIPFDSTPEIHIPVSWIQWAPPIAILVSKKGGNTHFFWEGFYAAEIWKCFTRLLVCSAVSCTMTFFIFPYFYELKKI